MSKIYMIVYNGISPPRGEFLQWMDAQPRILNWHATTLPPVFFVLWEGDYLDLVELLRKEAGIGQFVVAEAGPEKLGHEIQGWLPRATWDFIGNSEPKTSPVESSSRS